MGKEQNNDLVISHLDSFWNKEIKHLQLNPFIHASATEGLDMEKRKIFIFIEANVLGVWE